MRAAGQSLWRLITPYLLLGLVLAGGLYAINEHLAPDAKGKQDRIRRRRGSATGRLDQQWRERLNFQSPSRSWNVGAFNVVTEELRNPQVRQWLPRDAPWIFASPRLRWVNGTWRATNVSETVGRSASDPSPLRRFEPSSRFPQVPATPEEIASWSGKPWLVPYSYTVWETNRGVRTNLLVLTNAVGLTNLIVPILTNDRSRGSWQMAAYNPITRELLDVRVTLPLAEGANRLTYAEAGRWVDRRWVFEHVTDAVWRSSTDTDPLTTTEPLATLAMPELAESPEMLRSEVRINQLSQKVTRGAELSVAEIRNYRRLHPHVPARLGTWLDTQFQARLAAPWTCLVVVLIAVPFGVPAGRRNLFYGVAGSLALAFGYFVLQQVGFALGLSGQVPPWLGAWLPNLAFSALGVGLLCRVR